MADPQGFGTDVLDELMGTASAKLEQSQAAVRKRAKVLEGLENIDQPVNEAVDEATARTARVRKLILDASMGEVEQYGKEVDAGAGEAVAALLTAVGKVDIIFQNLGQPNDADKADLATAEEAVREAELAKAEAGQKWLASRRRAATEEAEADIAARKAAVEELKAEIQARCNARLRTAKIDSILQQLEVIARRVYGGLETERAGELKQLKIVADAITQLLVEQKQASGIFTELDARFNQETAELAEEEQKLKELASGSPEYAQQNDTVVTLRAKLRETQGNRNNALVKLQTLEDEQAQLEQHQNTHQKLSDNLRIFMTIVKEKTEARVRLFQSWLQARKAQATQDAAANVDRVGSEIDERSVLDMAAMDAASGRLTLDTIEAHPGRMRRFGEIAAVAAEDEARFRERMGALINEYAEKYGVDPMASSVLTYQGKDADTTSA